ncbi:LIS1 homology motif protein [Tanacetum coccineum]|uniref:LIS1 homology motif protein n=1 Tax=Tanacetum coccineum TaxID=301880 RepID=A0ABQ5AC38_9ASTR
MIAHAISHANSELLNEFLKLPKDASESWLSVKMALKQIAIKSRADDYTYKEMLQQINDLEAASRVAFFDKFITSFAYTFEGHEAPVYSVVDYDALGHSCMRMAYSADGIRVFSCGTSKEGEAHFVEWNESEGAIEREYSGFKKRSMGVVQFDTTKNRFLATGDEFQIKFWDMDNINLLTVTDADEGLPVSDRSSCTIDTVALTRNAEGGYTSQQPRPAVRGDNVPEAARQENENAPLGGLFT